MINNDFYEIYLIDSTTGSTGNYAKLDCEGIDFSSTFQVSDIADISTRKDAISKTINFKATKNNNVVFGNLSNLNRYVDETVNLSFLFNFDITKDIDCLVYENKVQIFKGKLHFISSNRDTSGNITYECYIKGYLTDFFSIINNNYLSSLDFSAFNHTYDINHITNSWNNIYTYNGSLVSGTTGQGYVYSLIDYGCNITPDTNFDNLYDYHNFRPSFYLNEYFNAIFNQSGLTGTYRYTVTGSTAFMNEFNRLIVPNSDSEFSYSVPPSIFFEADKTSGAVQYNGSHQTFYDNTYNRTEYNHLITFDTITTGATGQVIVSSALTANQRITFLNTVNTTVAVKVPFYAGQSQGTDATITLKCLYRTSPTGQFINIGQVAQSYPTAQNSGFGFNNLNPPTTLNLVLTSTFEAGSEIAFVLYIDAHSPSGVIVNYSSASVKLGSQISASQVTLKIGDTAVLVGQNTQTIKQVDFLKSVIQMFNLYVYPSPEDPKHIIFMPYDDYYSNFSTNNIVQKAINWTDKIDNASTFTQTPVSDIFNLYTFNFKEDSDYLSKYYKDRYGDTYGNLTITGSTNGQDKSIDLIFGSTPVANYNGRNVPYLWELDTDNTKKPKVTVPRLLFYNGLKNCSSYEIGQVSLSASTNTYYFSHIDSANTANYTFNQYAEANEFNLSPDFEFIDLTYGVPYEVYYTSGGTLTNYGSGKKNLYDRYYANQIAELTDSNTRIIELTAYLNEVDIQNLDFRTPVYFNSVLGNNYFKILKVEYSNNQTPATITLQTAYINDTNTPFAGYHNDTYSAFIQKNNCSSGYTGEASFYLVPQGKYTSFISQSDANAMAANEAATSGQTIANSSGICVYTGTSFSLGFATTPTDAKAVTPRATYNTSTGNLNTGATIFSLNGGSPTRNVGGYYANDTYYYHTDSNSTINSSGTTATLSGATYDAYFVTNSSTGLSCQIANNGTGTFVNYKISDPYPRLNTMVKTTSGSTASNGYYSDGTNAYQTVSGVIISLVSCNTRPPIIS